MVSVWITCTYYKIGIILNLINLLLSQAPLPCSYRGKYTTKDYKPDVIGKLYSDEVKNIINNAHNDGRKIAAFISESMISCGGQVVLPPNYLKNVYR